MHFVRFCNPKEMLIMILKPCHVWSLNLRWTCHFCSLKVSSMQYFTCVDSSRFRRDSLPKHKEVMTKTRRKKRLAIAMADSTSHDHRLYEYSVHRFCNAIYQSYTIFFPIEGSFNGHLVNLKGWCLGNSGSQNWLQTTTHHTDYYTSLQYNL